MGVMLSDGFDGWILAALEKAVAAAGAVIKIIAPRMAACCAATTTCIRWMNGSAARPRSCSMLWLCCPEETASPGSRPAVAFLTDAYQHCKFIGWSRKAASLVDAAGLTGVEDEGLVPLTDDAAVLAFVTGCQKLRLWAREARLVLS